MSITTTTATNAIREEYAPSYVEALFYNSFFGLTNGAGNRFFPVVKNPGDTLYRWKVHSSANDQIETFTEGTSHPDSGEEGFVNAALAYTYAWFVLEVSKIAEDALVSEWFDFVEESMELGKLGMTDLFTTTFLNDSAVGLQAAIDDNNTYATIARGSASYFESAVKSSIGTLGYDDFSDLHEENRSAEKGGRVNLWLAPQNLITQYGALPDFANTDVRNVVSEGGRGIDVGVNPMGHSYAGAPILPVDDLTNTVILGLDTVHGQIKIVNRHDLEVRPLAPTGYNNRLEVSCALAMPVKNPVKCAKGEGITA